MAVIPTYGGETIHYDLAKPDLLDSADIGIINANMDTIDENLFSNSTLYNKGQAMTNNDDLNASPYSTPGNYYCPSQAVASTLQNKPAGLETAFILKTYQAPANGRTYQLILTQGGRIYLRGSTSSAFTAWRTYYYEGTSGDGTCDADKFDSAVCHYTVIETMAGKLCSVGFRMTPKADFTGICVTGLPKAKTFVVYAIRGSNAANTTTLYANGNTLFMNEGGTDIRGYISGMTNKQINGSITYVVGE